MRAVLILLGIVLLSGCATKDDPDQVQLGPSIKEQKREARQREDFARGLPQPHP